MYAVSNIQHIPVVLYKILIFIIGATSSISYNTIPGYSRMENVTPVNHIYKSSGFPYQCRSQILCQISQGVQPKSRSPTSILSHNMAPWINFPVRLQGTHEFMGSYSVTLILTLSLTLTWGPVNFIIADFRYAPATLLFCHPVPSMQTLP